MYDETFLQYYVGDQELKVIIYESLTDLTLFSPEKWSNELLQYAHPDNDTNSLLLNLFDKIPQIQ